MSIKTIKWRKKNAIFGILSENWVYRAASRDSEQVFEVGGKSAKKRPTQFPKFEQKILHPRCCSFIQLRESSRCVSVAASVASLSAPEVCVALHKRPSLS